jgi:hypothetical protein
MYWLSRFWAHPVFNIGNGIGVIGLLVGVVGLYLYIADRKTRKLTYTVYPGRTIIVKAVNADESSALTVSYKDERVTTDVSEAFHNGILPVLHHLQGRRSG